MEQLKHLTAIACRSSANVLITGPTGSGKTYLAREIHERSSRGNKPFVTVNLATLHEGTLESELFGHERGAFTGADRKKMGRLECAQAGTVFLDEVGELTSRLQARLLEFLQSRKITPVGGTREIVLDVRVIAATNRNLAQAVVKGDFREDLFHRLRVISIELQPITERWADLDTIVHECLRDICANAGRSVLKISEPVAQKLEEYDWPGNFRELRNVLEYAVLAGDGPEIMLSDLPPWFGRKMGDGGGGSLVDTAGNERPLLGVAEVPLVMDFNQCLSSFEKEYLRRALQRFRGRINYTARKIGMSKTTLIRRMRTYGLDAVGVE